MTIDQFKYWAKSNNWALVVQDVPEERLEVTDEETVVQSGFESVKTGNLINIFYTPSGRRVTIICDKNGDVLDRGGYSEFED